MQIDFLRSEAQRHAAAAENGRLHAERLFVERARAIDIADGQYDVIDGFYFYGTGHPPRRNSARGGNYTSFVGALAAASNRSARVTARRYL